MKHEYSVSNISLINNQQNYFEGYVHKYNSTNFCSSKKDDEFWDKYFKPVAVDKTGIYDKNAHAKFAVFLASFFIISESLNCIYRKLK